MAPKTSATLRVRTKGAGNPLHDPGKLIEPLGRFH